MENKIMNFAIKQMKSDKINEIFNQEPFFEEYFKVFCGNKPFDKNIINSIQHELDINNVITLSNTLISIFENKASILSKIEIKNDIGLIIFIGDGKIDGHSIILNNSSYVFVDIKAIISRSNKNYDLDVFLSHEIIHAVHYDLNKEFYLKNYNSTEDKYLKTLIVEGVATYISMFIFGISENLGYWFGFLENDEVNEWVYNCKKMKTTIGINLKGLIADKKFDKNIYDKLFCIKSKKITFYRIGYYYGCEIIKNICYENNINEVFRLGFSDIKEYINHYFEIVIV
ncbi:hypothetical protein KPL35_13540 [Clostridium sp. CF011]|uniref:hypothetical protein n=1 Tax=Clostridium sp. CF011 TaxID=2843318 RepID=UPI001C0D1622|nr:hypothetical protein [Clostridium sp. CF011]MBU3093092.1 hypothetical protein [Clostridium sp. CF011]WAG71132.1 hypothetical protein LL036_06860 [Clostridium sp. CF011]